MLDDICLGRYYKVNSNIHSMNPIAKILCTILFIVISLMCNDLVLMGLILLLVISIYELGHLPNNIMYKTFFNLKYLYVFLIIFYIITHQSIIELILMILRLYSIVLFSTILTLTTPPTEIAYGLEKVLSPLKLLFIPVNKMALSISLALRFIPTIIDQSNKILKSQASRGIDYKNSNLKGKFIAVKSMLLPMFILTIKKADTLAESMQIRLYNINGKRTNFRMNKWSLFDTFLIMLHIFILSLLITKKVL